MTLAAGRFDPLALEVASATEPLCLAAPDSAAAEFELEWADPDEPGDLSAEEPADELPLPWEAGPFDSWAEPELPGLPDCAVPPDWPGASAEGDELEFPFEEATEPGAEFPDAPPALEFPAGWREED